MGATKFCFAVLVAGVLAAGCSNSSATAALDYNGNYSGPAAATYAPAATAAPAGEV